VLLFVDEIQTLLVVDELNVLPFNAFTFIFRLLRLEDIPGTTDTRSARKGVDA
jgi:hypothetical protein